MGAARSKPRSSQVSYSPTVSPPVSVTFHMFGLGPPLGALRRGVERLYWAVTSELPPVVIRLDPSRLTTIVAAAAHDTPDTSATLPATVTVALVVSQLEAASKVAALKVTPAGNSTSTMMTLF